MSKKTLVAELLQEVQQAKSMYQELVGDDDNDLSKCLFDTKIRAYSHALDLVEYHIHDEKDVLDINQIEKQIIDTVNDFLDCVKPSREANAFVYDILKQKIILALKDYNHNGWISVNDELPTNDDYILVYYLYDRYSDEKPYWDIAIAHCSNDNRKFYIEGRLCETVTHWQPLPEPPKE